MMESSHSASPLDPAAALREAEASRDALARQFDPGVWWFVLLGATIAAQIPPTVYGIAENDALVFIVGQLGFLLIIGALILLARRATGMRVGAFTNNVVFGVGPTATAVYSVGLAGALWAAYLEQWWIVAASAVVGGVGYALAGRRWLHRYHERPQELSSTAPSVYVMGACVAIAIVVFVLLVANR